MPAPQAWTLLVLASSLAAWVAARSYLRNSAVTRQEWAPAEAFRRGAAPQVPQPNTLALASGESGWHERPAPGGPVISMPPPVSAPRDEGEAPPATERRHDRLAVESAFYHLVTVAIPASVLLVVSLVTLLAWSSCWRVTFEQAGLLGVQLSLPLLAATKVIPACALSIRAWWRQRPMSSKAHAARKAPFPLLPADKQVFYFFGCLLLQLALDPSLALLAGAGAARSLSYASYQLFVDRLTDVTSGLSPMTIFLIGSAFFYVWGRCNLGRITGCRDVETNTGSPNLVSIALAEATPGQPATPLARAEAFLIAEMHDPIRSTVYQASIAITLLSAVALLVLKPPTSLEMRWPHVAIVCAISIVICITVSTMTHGALLLLRVGAFLRRLARHPIAASLHRVPAHLKRKAGDRIAEFRDHIAELETALELLESLDRGGAVAALAKPLNPSATRQDLDEAIQLFERGATSRRRQVVRRVLTNLVTASEQFTKSLRPQWASSHLLPRATDQLTDNERSSLRRDRARQRAAEQFVASIVVILVGRIVGLFRYFMVASTVGGLTMLVMVSTYPVQPHRLLASAAACLTVSAIALNLAILLQLERDEVVSRIAGTSIGKVDINGEVLSRIFVLVIVPAMSVIAVQFPRASTSIIGWLDPLFRWFR